jgi:DNA-binding MarR family transcriptional regulator
MVTIDRLPEQMSTAELNDPLSGSLCHELRKTSVAVMAAMSSEFGQWNLKPSEANLLKYVGANPGCTQSDIARAHRSNATNLVPLIARLEREELVTRAPGDGRTIALSVSEKGRDVLAKVDAGFERLESRLGAGLTSDQRALVVDALRIICKAGCHYDKP